MSDIKLLPDLKIIEEYAKSYYNNSTPPNNKHYIYLYQIYKHCKLKYNTIKKSKNYENLINLIAELNSELNDIYFKIYKRLNSDINLWKTPTTINPTIHNEYTYVNTTKSSDFIKIILDESKELEKLILKEFMNHYKNEYYYKYALNCKIDTLTILFNKLEEIYNFK